MKNSTEMARNSVSVCYVDNYDFQNIINIHKQFIQYYQLDINTISVDFEKRVDKVIELEKKGVININRELLRNQIIKEYKDNITKDYNKKWNDLIIKSLNILPITSLTNDDYVNFY